MDGVKQLYLGIALAVSVLFAGAIALDQAVFYGCYWGWLLALL